MILKLFAAVTALVLTFSGCVSGQTTSDSTTHTQNTPSSTVSSAVPNTTSNSTTNFTEIILLDNDICRFSIKGVSKNTPLGYTLNVYLENKTELELMFSLDQVSVNDYMIDPFWAASVARGKKANQQIIFLDSELEANSITQVEEITFTLHVYDNNDWMADHLVKEVFTVNP